jgi:AcrR family transcriptional regulator
VSPGCWRSGAAPASECSFRIDRYHSGITIPPLLDRDRRARLIAAATTIFAREGLGAPVPAIAAEAGVGVGTVYREFASKQELVAALVVARLDAHAELVEEALARDDPGAALRDLLWATAERQSADDVLGAALAAASEDPDVQASVERATGAMGELLRRAREAGAVRADVQVDDLKLVFAAVRGVLAGSPPGSRAWQRVLELLLDGLAPRP